MHKNRFTRVGFILAAAGSAVGLGNIWKFPYITGEYGGGAFVIIYLLCILFIGLTVFIAESLIGQNAQTNVATSFVQTSKSKNPKWKFVIFIVFSALVILSFYSLVFIGLFTFFSLRQKKVSLTLLILFTLFLIKRTKTNVF